jgi:hypothetical protein
LAAMGKFPTEEELVAVARAHGLGAPGRDESG